MDRLAPFMAQLAALAGQSRLRGLQPRAGIDFASNDYLGLAQSDRLARAVMRALSQGVPVGATGSRLLRGNSEAQEEFETKAAAFFRAESALGFGGGYSANHALLSTLPQRGDLLLLDELAHASSTEGARASRASYQRFRHNDATHAQDLITEWRKSGGTGAVWIAVESLYSMDGDRAPLDDFAQLSAEHGFLVIDEAHATGVFGPHGRGLSHALEGREDVITLHTLGKALGGSGAVVTLPHVLRDFMVNRARPFIFATAPSPLMAVAGAEALDILRDEPERQARLHSYITLFNAEISKRLPQFRPSESQIVPLVIGDNARVMALADAVQARGFDLRGIRPPTVPMGQARLRVSLTLNVTRGDLFRLIDTLEELCHDL